MATRNTTTKALTIFLSNFAPDDNKPLGAGEGERNEQNEEAEDSICYKMRPNKCTEASCYLPGVVCIAHHSYSHSQISTLVSCLGRDQVPFHSEANGRSLFAYKSDSCGIHVLLTFLNTLRFRYNDRSTRRTLPAATCSRSHRSSKQTMRAPAVTPASTSRSTSSAKRGVGVPSAATRTVVTSSLAQH